MSCRMLRICTVGLLLLGLARAATNAPPELLLKLQQEIQQGNLDTAHSQLDVAIKEFPSDPGLFNLLGIVEAQRGKRAAAESAFRKAVERSPEFTGALLNLGRLYMEQAADDPKASGRALDVYQKILRYDRTNAEALYQSAVLLASAGSYQNSLNHLDRLPQDVQQRAQVLAIRCADHAGLNQTAPAASTAESLLKSPDLTEADVMSALPQVEAHDEALALRLLEGLAERKLAGRAAMVRLGSYYQRQGKLPQAREALEQAEQAGTPSVEILSELARVAYQQHDRDGALGYLAHARDLDPNNARHPFLLWRGLHRIEPAARGAQIAG